VVKIKLHYPPEPPSKPIPFSKGLQRVPRRYHGWLALFCLLIALSYIVFGFYVHLSQPPERFRPLVVSPGQTARWIEQNRPLQLVELWEDDQSPQTLLAGALRVKPLAAASRQEQEEQIRRFCATLPDPPRPWLICYSLGPETSREVSRFIELLTQQGLEHVYALGGAPEQWEKAGLLRTARLSAACSE
jgi:hypothetical protein